MSDDQRLSHCAKSLRRHDHDRFLTCLFAPAERRDALFALYCFNYEVARTAEAVSESMLGQIRLQWWREALDGIYGGQPRRHEVVEPLARAVDRHGLTRDHFERLIDGREFDLDGEPPESLTELRDYAEATSASLVLLALEVLGALDTGPDGKAARQAGRHVGAAWALTGLLRAIPFHARQKRLYLPADLSEQAGLKIGDLFELRSSAALKDVVAQVVAAAQIELVAARGLRRQVPTAAVPALLPAKLADAYLARLRAADFDPFDARVQSKPGGQAWRLALAAWRGRY